MINIARHIAFLARDFLRNQLQKVHRRKQRPVQPHKTVTRNFPEFFFHLKSLGFHPATCIDVGAADGTQSILQSFPDAHQIAFEPLPDFWDRLSTALMPYSHEIRKCALMENDEVNSLTLLRHKDLYGSSMMHSRSQEAEELVEVRVSTLDNELNNAGLEGPILLKTDCQGADLNVLRGGLSVLAKCDVVIVESSLFRFWGSHHPDFYDIVEFMKGHGFVVYDLLDGLCRPIDGALGQIDIAFVKEDGPLRQKKSW